MSLSDCIKCWDTPCTCGYEYRLDPKPSRVQQAAVILGIKEGTPEYEELLRITPEHHPQKDVP